MKLVFLAWLVVIIFTALWVYIMNKNIYVKEEENHVQNKSDDSGRKQTT